MTQWRKMLKNRNIKYKTMCEGTAFNLTFIMIKLENELVTDFRYKERPVRNMLRHVQHFRKERFRRAHKCISKMKRRRIKHENEIFFRHLPADGRSICKRF